MTTAGMIFMGVSVISVLSLAVFCISRVLTRN